MDVVVVTVDIVGVESLAEVVTLAPLQLTDTRACATVVEQASTMVAETNRLEEDRLADAGLA